jgi:hypothetical protein
MSCPLCIYWEEFGALAGCLEMEDGGLEGTAHMGGIT